jgi:hypothetical protein
MKTSREAQNVLVHLGIALFLFSLSSVSKAELVLHLTFDGTVEDQSEGENDGELLGDAEFGDDVPAALGGGQSLVLDNGGVENNGVRVEGSESLSTAEFTQAYWVKPTALQGNAGLERLTSRGADAFETALGDRNAVGGGDPLTLSYFAGSWETTDITIEENEWTHVAWRNEGEGDIELFINGDSAFIGPGGVVDGRIGEDAHLNVGTRHNEVEGFEGLMDELRHYDTALTNEDIKALASPAAGLPYVGVWNFDGDAKDSTGNGHDGELIDAEFDNDVPRQGGGNSLKLEGGAYVLIEHAESLNITNAITIAAWVKPVGEITWDGVIAKNPSDGSTDNHAGNFELRIENGGRHLHFLHQQGGNNDTAFHQGLESIIEPDIWTHVVVTAETESGDVNFYIDGELSETLEGIIAVDEFPTNENPLYIGSRQDLFTPFDGFLDEVVLHNEVLDADAVKDLFENGIVPPGDADGDGCSDTYETDNGLDPNDKADAELDPDNDGLTNAQECELNTKAQVADTDEDGLKDGVETNTGVYVDATNTGTNPNRADTDRDGLNDGVETKTGSFVSATDTGTDPLTKDSDGDGVGDGSEVAGGTNPNDKNDVPSVIRGGGVFTTTHVWTEGDPQISDAFTAEEVTLDPGEAENLTVEHPYIHYHDNANAPVFQDLSEPYPLWGPQGSDEGPGDRNDFAIRSVGNINITKAGTITFVCNSDDGFDLRIDGESIGEAGNRGRGNTFMEVDLTAGIHEVEFIHWERGGGAGVSVYVFRSIGEAPGSLNDSEWQLLEATGGGGQLFQITSITNSGDELSLTWASSAGAEYSIEYLETLAAEGWTELDDGVASEGDETSWTDPDPARAGLPNGWYRIREN